MWRLRRQWGRTPLPLQLPQPPAWRLPHAGRRALVAVPQLAGGPVRCLHCAVTLAASPSPAAGASHAGSSSSSARPASSRPPPSAPAGSHNGSDAGNGRRTPLEEGRPRSAAAHGHSFSRAPSPHRPQWHLDRLRAALFEQAYTRCVRMYGQTRTRGQHRYESELRRVGSSRTATVPPSSAAAASSTSSLPPFQHGAEFHWVYDVQAFRVYLAAVAAISTSRAQLVFDLWCRVHGFDSRFSSLYLTLLRANETRGREGLASTSALLRRLRDERVEYNMSQELGLKLVQHFIDAGDLAHACLVYRFARPTSSVGRVESLRQFFLLYSHHDCVAVAADVYEDLEATGKPNVPSITSKMRRLLRELLAHLQGQAVDDTRWTPSVMGTDARMKDARFVADMLRQLPEEEEQSPRPVTPAPVAAAFQPSHVVSGLQHLLHTGAATESAFIRAMELATPQGAVELWQLLESAQPAPSSISAVDPSLPSLPSLDQSDAARAAHISSSPLAPGPTLYNLAIQALCASGHKTMRSHAAVARGLFARMLQLGFPRTMLTYRRLMQALSGGSPHITGLQFVFDQHKADAEELRAQAHSRTEPNPAHGRIPHPEAFSFCVQISGYEAMLFAWTRTPPTNVRGVARRVRELDAEMRAQGLEHSERTLNSLLRMALYMSDTPLAHKVWEAIREANHPLLPTTCHGLLQMYTGKSLLRAPKPLSFPQLRTALHSVPYMHAVWGAMQEHKVSIRPIMWECRIEALARAYAACLEEQPAHREELLPLPAYSDPLQLLVDVVGSFREAEQQELVLSKHIYIIVASALHSISVAVGRQQEAVLASMEAAQSIDIGQVSLQLLGAMDRAGHSPPPQLLVSAFYHSCAALSPSSDPAPLHSLLDRLLRLARQPDFLKQRLRPSQSDTGNRTRRQRSHTHDAACTGGEEDDMASLASVVQRSLVLQELESTACTRSQLSVPSRPATLLHTAALNRSRAPPIDGSLLIDVLDTDGTPLLSALRPRSDGGTTPNVFAENGEGASQSASSLPVAPSEDARQLVLHALRSMMSSVLARELATRDGRTQEFDVVLISLIESLWEGAGVYGVRDALFSGSIRFSLPRALLHLQHSHASSILLLFQRTLDPIELVSVPSVAAATADLLLCVLEWLVRVRAPLAEVEEVLLQLEHLPATLQEQVMADARVYKSVFIAYARERHSVKILAYFQRALLAHDDEAHASALTGSALELVEALDRCGDVDGLEEVQRALEHTSTHAPAHGSREGEQSRVDPAVVTALMRAYVRLDAFAAASDSNGWHVSNTGNDVLARAIRLLHSPLALRSPPDLAVLLPLLKCALHADDLSSVDHLLSYLSHHDAALASSHHATLPPSAAAHQLSVASLLPLCAGWPPVESAWSSTGDRYPTFLWRRELAPHDPHQGSGHWVALAPDDGASSQIGVLASRGDVRAVLDLLRQVGTPVAAFDAQQRQGPKHAHVQEDASSMRAQFDSMLSTAACTLALHVLKGELPYAAVL